MNPYGYLKWKFFGLDGLCFLLVFLLLYRISI